MAAEQRIRERVGAVVRQRDALQKVFARDFPDYVALSNPLPLPAREIQNLLSDDEALVLLFTGDKETHFTALTREGVEWKTIPLGEQLDGGNIKIRKSRPQNLPVAGTRLIREWQGIEHCVTIRDDGFEYQGRPYKSLSAIARAITNTRWNGLVFFGLKNQRASL